MERCVSLCIDLGLCQVSRLEPQPHEELSVSSPRLSCRIVLKETTSLRRIALNWEVLRATMSSKCAKDKTESRRINLRFASIVIASLSMCPIALPRDVSSPERAATSCLVDSEARPASSRRLLAVYPEQSRNELIKVSTHTSSRTCVGECAKLSLYLVRERRNP